MSTSPPPEPDSESNAGFFGRIASFFTDVGKTILALAKLVLDGQATASQNIFFAIGVLAIACIAAFAVFALWGETTFVFITFAVLAVVLLTAICLMAWLMGAGAGATVPRSQDTSRLAEVDKENQRLVADVQVLRAVKGVYEIEADRIANHYRKAKDRFPVVLEDVTTITIEKTGAVHVVERRKLKADDTRPQHFLIDSFTGTTALGSFQALGFQLHVHSGHYVAYLPSLATASEQPVLLVFLPPLAPSDANPVDFTVSWGWPVGFQDLVDTNKKRDYYSTLVRSPKPVPLVRLIFRIHKDIPAIKLIEKGTALGKEIPTEPDLADPEYRRYVWEAREVEDDKTVAVWLTWA